MRNLWVLALVLVLPASVRAEPLLGFEKRSSPWQLSLRTAFALPFGNLTDASGDSMSQMFSNDIPIALEVNYRISPQVYLGAFGQYGFAALSSPLAATCSAGSCALRTLRFGVGAYWHLRPRDTLDPWLGLAIDWEQARISASGAGGSGDATIWGFEYPVLQAGVDWQSSPSLAFGPYVAVSMGEYYHADYSGGPSGSIDNRSVHGWFDIGLKMTFSP
jgi:hypothetical protein